jgi:hypothetical protein
MRKKISDKVAAASRNNAAPILSVLFEPFLLERIDLVANKAGYRHWYPPSGRSGLGIATAKGQRSTRRQDDFDGFAAAYPLG